MRLYGRLNQPLVEAKVDTAATMEMREDTSLVSYWFSLSDHGGREAPF